MGKVFLIDVKQCNGCYNCQIVCKDEHCDNDWRPYAAPQPQTGHFWMKMREKVRGQVPWVRVAYQPVMCQHCEKCPVLELGEADGSVYRREDGLVVIDPEKAKGREDIAEKFEGVYWNAELNIPQGCTGCAHLLDDGWTVPRCVDACAVGGLRFGDEADFADEIAKAEKLDPKSNVYYLNLPKRWVAGQAIDPMADEVIIGAKVTMQEEGNSEGEVFTTTTDEFGDFWFRQVEGKKYHLWFDAEGYVERELTADATEADCNMGRIGMYKMIPLG